MDSQILQKLKWSRKTYYNKNPKPTKLTMTECNGKLKDGIDSRLRWGLCTSKTTKKFDCFVALCPKSTAMVMAGRSVHLTTLFSFLNDSAEGRRMTVEIISQSISTKVWDQAGIELATPGFAVRLASVARHITNCVTRPSTTKKLKSSLQNEFWFSGLLREGNLLLHCIGIN